MKGLAMGTRGARLPPTCRTSEKGTYSSVNNPPKLSMELIGQDRKSATGAPLVPIVAKIAAGSFGYNEKNRLGFADA
jgi:hypothetical protein